MTATRQLPALAGLVLAAACSTAPAPKGPRRPSVEGIDYRAPSKYLAIDPAFATKGELSAIVAKLKRPTQEATLGAIHGWIDRRLRLDPKAAYGWRPLARMLADGTYGGCADQAVLFGALAQAAGIPTVWVKTMDVGWIRRFRSGRRPKRYEGHVFLEQHVDGRWVLVDASAGRIYADYDPRTRLLPGNRYAYDKGARPYELVLSLRWQAWLRQTHAHFAGFDISRLPVGEGRALAGLNAQRIALIPSDRQVASWMQDRLQQLGLRVHLLFTHRFERWLPASRGGTIILTAIGDRISLPDRHHAAYAPTTTEALRQLLADREHGEVERRLDDGTRVVLVYGRTAEALRQAIQRLVVSRAPGS